MKVLGANETGRGILIEYDAGHVSPDDNKKIIAEMKDMDFSQDLILYAVLQSTTHQIKTGESIPRFF